MMLEVMINLAKLRGPGDVAKALRGAAEDIEKEGLARVSPGERTVRHRVGDFGYWLIHGSRRHLKNHDARVREAFDKFDA